MDVTTPMEEALFQIRFACNTLRAAQQMRDENPCRANEIAVKAARKLVKEATARGQEWVVK